MFRGMIHILISLILRLKINKICKNNTELEMKQTLEAGEKILLDKPELNEMLPEDVLDRRDKGESNAVNG